MSKNILISIILAIAVGAAAFFGGIQYQKSQTTSFNSEYTQNANTGFGGSGMMGRRLGRGFGGATLGKIVSQDADSITIQLSDGSSKIINILDTTRIVKTETASKSDLTTGQTVAAFGTANTDGSITAQNIQLNPMMRRGTSTATPSAQ